MWNKKKTQVLVVGAGPVGLTAAVRLLQQGIEFEIVDKALGICQHSKACLLSPETLEFLDEMGLLNEVFKHSIGIKTIQLFAGRERLGNLSLSGLPARYPFVVSIPQNELEGILVERLDRYHKEIRWNHRVSGVEQGEDGLTVNVDRLGKHMMGYAVTHEETLIDRSLTYQVKAVLAADGMHSLIRRLQKIEYEPVGAKLGTLLFEIKRNPREDAILRLGFTEEGTSAYVPLPHGIARYGFTTDHIGEISADRDTAHEIYEEDLEHFPELTDTHFNELLHARMPYIENRARDIVWRASVPFGVQLAERIWSNGIFLLGDAARSGFPLGAKSLNLGLPEASKAVIALNPYLEHGDASQLEDLGWAIKTEWEDLSSLVYFAAKTGSGSSGWSVDPNVILQALPLTGKDLDYAAHRLAKIIKEGSGLSV